MSIISEYRLTHYSMKLLEYLMYYRGMTALQLTRLYYNVDEPLQSQKTNIHNYLSKLKKQSLVASKKTRRQYTAWLSLSFNSKGTRCCERNAKY